MKRSKTILIVALAVLITAAIIGRISARKDASDYGRTFKKALSVFGRSSFADTSKLHKILASPEMSAPHRRLKILSFLGGGYRARADELQLGMIYLSQQMALVPEQRLSAPPKFSYLSFGPNDRTDDGIFAAVTILIDSYESQL